MILVVLGCEDAACELLFLQLQYFLIASKWHFRDSSAFVSPQRCRKPKENEAIYNQPRDKALFFQVLDGEMSLRYSPWRRGGSAFYTAQWYCTSKAAFTSQSGVMERLFGHIFLRVPHNPPQALFEVAARQLHSARFEKRLLQTEHMMYPTLRQPRCGLRKSSRTSRSTPEVFRNMASRDCPQGGFGRPVALEWPACGVVFGGMSFPLLTR